MAFLTPFKSQVSTSSSPRIIWMTELSWESGWPGTHRGIPLQHRSEPARQRLGHLQKMFYHKPIWKWSTPYFLKYAVFLKNWKLCFGLLVIVLSLVGGSPFNWAGEGQEGAELGSTAALPGKEQTEFPKHCVCWSVLTQGVSAPTVPCSRSLFDIGDFSCRNHSSFILNDLEKGR